MNVRVRLGDVAEFVNGAAFKPSDWSESGLPIIRIQNLTDLSKPFNRTTRPVGDKLRVRPGDLLVSWSATLGVFEWPGREDGLLNQHIFRVLPDASRIDTRYLRWVLVGAIDDMQRHLHGATMQHVNRGEFLATSIYLPSLDEQRRIAAILDSTDALRTERGASLTLLDGLMDSMFLEMFGDPIMNPYRWPRQMLGELLSAIESGVSPVCHDRPAASGEWGVLKLGAVTKCVYDPTENKALPDSVKPRPEHEVRVGDLLFSRKNTRDLVGACAIVRQTPGRMLLPDLIFRLALRRGADVEPAFLQQLLVFPTKRKAVQQLANGSAASMPNISKARLRGLEIEIPPRELQLRFLARYNAAMQVQARYELTLGSLDELMGSLQHAAFRGEL